MTLEELMKLAEKKQAADAEAARAANVSKGISLEDMAGLFAQFETKMEEKISKALPVRQEGVGRKGPSDPQEQPIETDPAGYIVTKALSGDKMNDAEKALAWGLTYNVLTDGMKD